MNNRIIVLSVLILASVVSAWTLATSLSSNTTNSAESNATLNSVREQSTTTSGVPIAASGFVYTVVESPQCYPQCLMPSLFLTYLYIPPGTECNATGGCYPPPQYYRLLAGDGSPFLPTVANGTYVHQLTGLLATPSSWNCESLYIPKICMLGDIYVQSLS